MDKAVALRNFIYGRIAAANDEEVTRYHQDECAIYDLNRWGTPCDCDGPTNLQSLLFAIYNATDILTTTWINPEKEVAVLMALAAPWADHPDYPMRPKP